MQIVIVRYVINIRVMSMIPRGAGLFDTIGITTTLRITFIMLNRDLGYQS